MILLVMVKYTLNMVVVPFINNLSTFPADERIYINNTQAK
jgi:hypothetical protein